MTSDRVFLFNRSLEISGGGWIHIVPKGELENAGAGMVQVLDDAALDSILANLESERAHQSGHWPGLYAGREHFVYEDDQDSAALAWFKEFQRRPDGIYASADGLTPPGRQAIANQEYKFTSFVADRKDTQSLGGNRHRILRVDTIGFTNQANGKELLTPITNRQAQAPAPARAAAQHFQPSGRFLYDTVAGLVANRLKKNHGGYDLAHALVATRNRDLVERSYETLDTTRHFGRLVNRVENRTGLSSVKATNRSAEDAAAMCKRFTPTMQTAPAAAQWDALWRAAEALAEAGVPDRLCNRAPEGVTAADWKSANGRAVDVLALLDAEATRPVDRGTILENAPACQVRGVFRGAIERLIREQNLTRHKAFEQLKRDEPILWTLAMLSFET